MNNKTENALYEILKSCRKYAIDLDSAERAFYPLEWYVTTGRSSGGFNRIICDLNSRQKTTIAKRLVQCGGLNYDESLDSVKDYIAKCRSWA